MRKSDIIGILLLAFVAGCHFIPPMADFYAERCYPVISAVLSFCAAAVPFSLEEIVVLGFAAAIIAAIVRAIRKKERFLRWLGRTARILMWLTVWFYMGWGNNYGRTGLYQRNGIQRVSFEQEHFKAFLEDYARELNRAAAEAEVHDGIPAQTAMTHGAPDSRPDQTAMIPRAYDKDSLESDIRDFYSDKVSAYGYTHLHRWQHVKKPLLNRLYSAVSVLGFVGPFFCESQVNRDLLDYEYPYTAAHEMGHLAGVTSEAEASYWGFAFCRDAQDAAVRYSGYLAILPYVVSNAKALLPQQEYDDWSATLCDRAKTDYNNSRTYWMGKRVPWISKLQNWFYNIYLKSNGISEGVKDYSGVVSMIMTMDASGE